ncbi:hypothetical protein [Limnospira platensis]|uniref:hypothetical protein n=1 Tax=Limnospira platensis TaxID=118562 RepID=UPI0001D0E8B1|nr:hypothetical protein [Arthrospira platensis]BAI94002.1 hypothetical protein NIES39_P00220 [Arthrospira platensis NIES-39]
MKPNTTISDRKNWFHPSFTEPTKKISPENLMIGKIRENEAQLRNLCGDIVNE